MSLFKFRLRHVDFVFHCTPQQIEDQNISSNPDLCFYSHFFKRTQNSNLFPFHPLYRIHVRRDSYEAAQQFVFNKAHPPSTRSFHNGVKGSLSVLSKARKMITNRMINDELERSLTTFTDRRGAYFEQLFRHRTHPNCPKETNSWKSATSIWFTMTNVVFPSTRI